MTLSCSYLSRRLTPMKTSLTCRIHWVLLLAGWLLTFCASIVLIVLLSLRPQLNQIHNPVLLFNNGTSVSPAVSACNLSIIFWFSPNFRRSNFLRLSSMLLPHPLFSTHFCTMVFQKLNWIAFNTSRNLLPVLLLLLLDHPTLTSFSNLSIG